MRIAIKHTHALTTPTMVREIIGKCHASFMWLAFLLLPVIGFGRYSGDCVSGLSLTPATQTICQNGTPTNLTAIINVTGGSGASNFTYQWYSNTTASTVGSTLIKTTNANTGTPTDLTDLIIPPTGTAVTTYYYVVVTNSDLTCPTVAFTSSFAEVIVNPVLVPDVSIVSGSGNSICAGTNVTFTATPTNAGATPSYQWLLDGNNVGTNSNSYTNAGLTNGQKVKVIVTSSDACSNPTTDVSNEITMTVNPVLVPSVTINASTTDFCSGSTVTFDADIINGGLTPGYQWYINGSPAGNASTLSTASLVNGDIVSLQVTSGATCASPLVATSNNIQVTVHDNLPVSVSVSPSANGICPGTNVTFTATPTNGGTSPSYQWYIDGVAVGTNSATYSNSGLTNGQNVTVVMTSNATCVTGNPATSTAINMSVFPNKPVSVTVAPSINNICAGTSVTFTATPVNGGANPSYQWKVNGVNAGTNSNIFTTSSLSDGNAVTVVMTSNDGPCLTGNPATSAPVFMTVNPVLPVSVSVNASATTICAGQNITFTATPTNGGTVPSYQWKVNGVNVGTDNSTYSTTSLTNGQTVTVVLNSSESCTSGNPATSAGIPITVNPILPASVSIAASANPICSGSSVTFTATPTNGGTTPAYQWYVGATPVGTNSNTYTTSSLTNGQVVKVVMTSSANCISGSPATSNTVTMTVNPVLPVSVSIAASATTICTGTSVTFTATPTNGGTSPSYQWKLNGANVGTNSNTYTTTGLANGNQITVVMTSNASPCASGSPATSNTVTMTVNANVIPSVSISSTATDVCSSTSTTFTATPTNGGTTPTYQWKLNGNNISGATSSTYTRNSWTTNDVITVVMTSNAVCPSPASVTSNAINMNVYTSAPANIANNSITGPQTICPIATGLSYTVTAVARAQKYLWSFSPSAGFSIVGGNNTNNITVDVSNAALPPKSVTVSVYANNPCGDGNARTYTVNVGNSADVDAGADISVCAGSSAQLGASLIGAAASMTWSAPSGSFSNVNSLTSTYTPSITSGTVTLLATTNAGTGLCPNPGTDQVVITVYAPPAIGTQPIGTTVCSGTPINLSVGATGTGLTYQWKKNGTDISGATASSYSIANPTSANSGTYTVVVSGTSPCPSVTSANAVVTVNDIVAITTQPVNKTVCSGTNVNYSVTATGTGLTYQWYKGATPLTDGGNISGSLTSSLTITGATSANASSDYHVVVSGTSPCSPVTSSIASLTVNDAVAINTQPAGTTICSGTPLNLSVGATGTGLTYQWKKNGTDIGGATGSSYSIANPTSANNGTYSVVVSGTSPCPSVTSANAVVTVNDIVAITTQPVNKTVCSGSNVNYTVAATGSGLTYQWYKGATPLSNGGNISGSTTNSLLITGASATDASSDYHVVVTGTSPCSPVTSSIVSLTVNDAVSIGTQPVPSTTVCAGTPVNLSVSATGTGLTYQWKKNGSNIGGAIADTYTIANPTSADNGTYTVVVSGTSPCPAVTSANALVTVNQPAVITTDPVSKTVCSGTNTSFTVVASGTALTYQWYKGPTPLANGGNISGVNTATLVISGASAADASADYHVVVTGASPCSPATSASASLVVNDAVVINSQPVAMQTACSGSTVTLTVDASGTGLTYQWRKGTTNLSNGGNISGVNTSTLTISNIDKATDAANNYNVVITGTSPCSAVTSNNATIIINRKVTIGTQPANVGVCASNPASLSVVVNGDGLTYQWYKGNPPGTAVVNGGQITGAQSNILNFAQASLGDNGAYYVVVSGLNPCTDITSNIATLNVDQAIVITTQPAAQTVCENAANTTFTVVADAGGDPLTYQWRRNGTNISGATNASYTIPTTTLATAGDYDVVISGPAGYTCTTATSAKAVLTVTPSVGTPVFAAGATSTICQASSPVTYTATASNNTGITYTLDATSLGAGNTINASTGQVTYAPGWSGTSTITASASGCNGPKSATHTVTITPTVGTPTAITGTPPTCQLLNGTTTTAFSTTATNNTGFNWSLSNSAAGTINPTTGVVTWANGFSGSTNIRVTANGCNGPSAMVSYPVTITPTVGTPTAITGTPPTCQLINGTTTTAFGTTATNTTGFNWTLSDPAAGTIDPATGLVTWANGYSGALLISVTANGCNGPSSPVTKSVTITPSVTTPVFASGTSSIRCQGPASVTYLANATNTTGITYSLDAASVAGGNTINASTGQVNYVAGWSGTTTITASAAGCNGPLTATHTVTVTPIPAGGTTTPSSSLFECAGANGGIITLSGQTGTVSKWQYSLNAGGTWTDINNTTTSLTYTNLTQSTWYRAVVTQANCPGLTAYSAYTPISVVPQSGPGSLSAIANPTVICSGSSTLTATGFGMDSTVGALTGGSFDQAGATMDNQQTPGLWRKTLIANWDTQTDKTNIEGSTNNADNSAFNLTNGPKTFLTGSACTDITYNNYTLDGVGGNQTKFMAVVGGNTSSLETPIFNLIGLTSASMDWYEAYVLTAGASIKIELSLDGGASYNTTLKTITGPTSYASPTNFLKSSLNLNQYVGLSNLRVRFTYTGTACSTWGLEKATITKGTLPANYTWNLYDPIPQGTGTPPDHYLNVFTNPSVIVTPPSPNMTGAPIVYHYNFVSSAGGCASNITVTVNPVLVASSTNPNTSICSGSAMQPITFTSNIAGTTYSWTRTNGDLATGNITGIAASGTGTIPAATLVNTTSTPQTITFSITPAAANSCNATVFTASFVVNPNITVSLSGGGTICGSATAPLVLTSAGPFPVDVTLSNGVTYTMNSSPLTINVAPASTTTYSITNVGTSNCASVPGSGTATVTVLNTTGITGTWLCGSGDGDWFNPCNWANSIIPTNNIDVIIGASASCNPVINPTTSYALVNGPIAYSRNITIEGARNLSFANGGELDVAGNWLNNVGPAGFTANNGTVVFMGNSTNTTGCASQTITTTSGNTETFNNLVINNTCIKDGTGDNVVLNNPVNVGGVLTLTDGIVKTADDKLLTVTNTSVNAVVGGATNTYVFGPIQRLTNSTSEYLFPVGAPSGPYGVYRPAIVRPETSSAAGYTATYHPTIEPEDPYDAFITGVLKTEYWDIDRSSGTTNGVIKLPYIAPTNYNDWTTGQPCPYCVVAIAEPYQPSTDYWYFVNGANNNSGYTNQQYTDWNTSAWIESPLTSPFGTYSFGFFFNVILPVTDFTFTGKAQGADALLQWTLSQGNDYKVVDLQHSRNGRDFTRLITKTINGDLAFQQLHVNPGAGLHYYRLVLKDSHGKVTYSTVLVIVIGTDITVLKGIRPTMVQYETFASIHSAKVQNVRLKILDMQGRIVGEMRSHLVKGENTFNVNTSMLVKGMYNIYMETEDGIKGTFKFMKQ